MRATGAVLLAMAVWLAAGGAQARISGDARDSFTRSFKAACLESQQSNSANQRVSNNLLQQYCACNAAFIADRITPDQLAGAAGPAGKGVLPAWFSENARAASSYCSADLGKYASVAS